MNLLELFAKIGLDSSEFHSGLSAASNAARSFGSGAGGVLQSFGDKAAAAFSAVGKAAAAGLTAASGFAVAFGADAVKVGQSFDTSMSQVAATMGFSVEQLNTKGSEAAETFAQLRDFAQDMGAKTAFSASQAADALNYMALAGYDADTSIQMLPNVLNLAAAGAMDLAAASDMITDSQSALGLTLEQTSELVDKMAKASSKSNTSVSQLGDAILTVGGTARDLAGGTTELATVLGILADNGIKGAEGGTALRNIMQALIPKSEKAAKAYEAMGISAYDANGNLKPLSETFAAFNKAMEGKSSEERSQFLSRIFNVYDLKSVNALLGTSTERWNELSGAIDDASGAARAMADTQLDNLAGDITIFQSALEGAKIAVSDELTPALREFVRLGTRGLSDLSAAIKEDGLGGAMKALGPFIDNAVGMLMEGIPKVIEFGGQLLGAIVSGIIDNLPKLAEGTARVAAELGTYLLNAAPEITAKGGELLDFFAGGIIENADILADTAINLIDTFAGFLADAIPSVSEKLTDVIVEIANAFADPEGMENLAASALTILDAIATAIITDVPRLGDAALNLLRSFGGMLVDHADELVDTALNVIDAFAGFLGDAIPDFLEIATDVIIAFAKSLSDPNTLANLASSALAILEGIATGIVDNLPRLAEAAIDVLLNFGQYLWDNKETLLKTVGDIVMSLINAVIDSLDVIGDKLAEKFPAFSFFFENLETIVMTVVGAFAAFKAALAINTFIGTFSKAIEGAGLAFQGLNAIMAANPILLIVTIIGALVAALVTLWNTNEDFRDAVKGIWDAIVGFFSAAWDVIKSVWGVVGDFFGGVWDGIKGVFSGIGNWFGDRFREARERSEKNWETAKTFFSGVWDGVKGVFSKVGDYFGEKFKQGYENAKRNWEMSNEFFSGVWNGIKGVFSTAGNWLGDRFQEGWKNSKENWEVVGGWFGDRWNDIKSGLSTAGNWLGDRFQEGWTNSKKNWEIVGGWFGDRRTDIQNALSGVGATIGGYFQDSWNRTQENWKAAGTWFGQKYSEIKTAMEPAKDWLGEQFGKAWENIKSAFGGVKDFFSDVWNDITGVFSGAFDWFKNIGSNIVNGMKEGVGGLWNGFLNFIGVKTDEVKEEFTGKDGFDEHSPSKWSETVFKRVLEGGEIGFDKGLPAMLESAKKAVRDIQDALAADPFQISGGYSYSSPSPYQLAAASASNASAVTQIETVRVEQPIQVILNDRVLGETMYTYLTNRARAKG